MLEWVSSWSAHPKAPGRNSESPIASFQVSNSARRISTMLVWWHTVRILLPLQSLTASDTKSSRALQDLHLKDIPIDWQPTLPTVKKVKLESDNDDNNKDSPSTDCCGSFSNPHPARGLSDYERSDDCGFETNTRVRVDVASPQVNVSIDICEATPHDLSIS